VNAARGLKKSFGEQLRKCGTEQVGLSLAAGLDPVIGAVVGPLLAEVETLNHRIAEYTKQIEKIAEQHYPEVAGLKKINGVGTLIALTFVITVDDPLRFRRSRDVGCYLGLRPGRRNSGDSEPQMPISEEGDSYLRRLMVQGAHTF
jgi:transposase